MTPDLAELSKKLPGGRVYANGKGFVPNIRKNLFEKIIETAGVTLPTASPIPPPSLPSSWDDIDVGKIVLACHTPHGWWEAVVTEKNDDLFTLRWREAPKDPAFIRKATALALLNAGVLTP